MKDLGLLKKNEIAFFDITIILKWDTDEKLHFVGFWRAKNITLLIQCNVKSRKPAEYAWDKRSLKRKKKHVCWVNVVLILSFSFHFKLT